MVRTGLHSQEKLTGRELFRLHQAASVWESSLELLLRSSSLAL